MKRCHYPTLAILAGLLLPAPDRPAIGTPPAQTAAAEILFVSHQESGREIWRISPEGSGLTRLTRTPGAGSQDRTDYRYASDPGWSPDRTQIAFSSKRGAADETSGIWIMNANGSRLRQLNRKRYLGDPAWSPDGEWIAYTWFPHGQMMESDLWLLRSDGSEDRRLTELEGEESEPDWSPDGTQIIFDFCLYDERRIMVLDVAGGEIRPFPVPDADRYRDGEPRWSPDGTRVLLTSDRDGREVGRNLYVVNRDGSGLTQLTRFTGSHVSCFEPTWSPDGTMVAFRANPEAEVGSDALRRFEIFVLDLATGDMRRLTDNQVLDESPCWR